VGGGIKLDTETGRSPYNKDRRKTSENALTNRSARVVYGAIKHERVMTVITPNRFLVFVISKKHE